MQRGGTKTISKEEEEVTRRSSSCSSDVKVDVGIANLE